MTSHNMIKLRIFFVVAILAIMMLVRNQMRRQEEKEEWFYTDGSLSLDPAVYRNDAQQFDQYHEGVAQ